MTTNIITIELTDEYDVERVVKALKKLNLIDNRKGKVSITHEEVTKRTKWSLSAPKPHRP